MQVQHITHCTCINNVYVTGRHCCLWCLIKAEQLHLDPSEHGPVQSRTTESITEDHNHFKQDGSNIKRAKLFNNAVGLPLFPAIPLKIYILHMHKFT